MLDSYSRVLMVSFCYGDTVLLQIPFEFQKWNLPQGVKLQCILKNISTIAQTFPIGHVCGMVEMFVGWLFGLLDPWKEKSTNVTNVFCFIEGIVFSKFLQTIKHMVPLKKVFLLGATLEAKRSTILLRFGKALAKLRTAHIRQVRKKAKTQLKFAMSNYHTTRRNTRASARWSKFADLGLWWH